MSNRPTIEITSKYCLYDVLNLQAAHKMMAYMASELSAIVRTPITWVGEPFSERTNPFGAMGHFVVQLKERANV